MFWTDRVLRLQDGDCFSLTVGLWIVLSAEEAVLPFAWCKRVCKVKGSLTIVSPSAVTAVGSGSVRCSCSSCWGRGHLQLSWLELLLQNRLPVQSQVGTRNWVAGLMPLCPCPPSAARLVTRCVFLSCHVLTGVWRGFCFVRPGYC